MIGVAEDDLGAERFNDVLRNGFDGSSSADRHENRRFDGLMGQMDLRAPAARVGCMDKVEVETHVTILSGRTSATIQIGREEPKLAVLALFTVAPVSAAA